MNREGKQWLAYTPVCELVRLGDSGSEAYGKFGDLVQKQTVLLSALVHCFYGWALVHDVAQTPGPSYRVELRLIKCARALFLNQHTRVILVPIYYWTWVVARKDWSGWRDHMDPGSKMDFCWYPNYSHQKYLRFYLCSQSYLISTVWYSLKIFIFDITLCWMYMKLTPKLINDYYSYINYETMNYSIITKKIKKMNYSLN
jgi:hypothetical protein